MYSARKDLRLEMPRLTDPAHAEIDFLRLAAWAFMKLHSAVLLGAIGLAACGDAPPAAGMPHSSIVDDRPIIISSLSSSFLTALDHSGRPTGKRALPISALKELPDFARSVVAASNGGNVWAIAFPYGNVLLVYEGLELRCSGKLVTGVEFPTGPVQTPTFSVSAIALRDTTVVVLANGGGEFRLRHVDSYSLSDCHYIESWELPRKMSAMAVNDDTFVFEFEDSTPVIIGLKMK
jgi:hypothetical protein